MKKDTIIVFNSSNISRLFARRSLASIKTTNLDRAEIHISDNGYDEEFSLSVSMERCLKMAQRRGLNVLFLHDDVEIYRYDWIDRLYKVSSDLGADIVSCIQSGDNGKDLHVGECINPNGTTTSLTDFRHPIESVAHNAVYAPVLCSAIMLVREPQRYSIDGKFRKYKQDLDVCMQAWDQGRKVGLALDMDLIHNRGFPGEQHPSFLDFLSHDAAYFANKWKDRLEKIRNLPELVAYNDQARLTWTQFYNLATESILINPDEAKGLFLDVIENCYIPRWVAGAHFYLFQMTNDVFHLRECNRINPCHVGARKKLLELGEKPQRSCALFNDCRTCNMKRFG